ncbi:catalase-related peroxidase [Nocardioides baekrokdamisoli]|uniref:Catalase-related peroxidase n=1 Tax=Nocardioides baekrokdamisoli TaxID=1804624 RepID=A0A3G9ICL8_9ACTN|nr:catalase [Nocardioides baekrokdamisoli]BBH16112.1 catalase-related peroxidase [Nocardioides baekrokdamisoli]
MTDATTADARLRRAFHASGPHRTLHAKGTYASGTFTAAPRSAELGIAAHLQGSPVPVLVRFSNGSGNPKSPDKAPDVRGMSVSFRTETGATDLLGQTAPRFPVKDPGKFVEMTEAVAAHSKPWKLAAFLARNPSVLGPLAANAKAGAIKPPKSFAEATYYPVHAYAWIAPDGSRRWVRYIWRPVDAAAAATPTGANWLVEELATRLSAGPARWDLEVSVASESDDPHDPTSQWKPVETFIAGTLSVDATAPDPEADGSIIVFDPTRIIPGIELSNDPILLFRAAAYSASASHRA